jgi:hypothetical protein
MHFMCGALYIPACMPSTTRCCGNTFLANANTHVHPMPARRHSAVFDGEHLTIARLDSHPGVETQIQQTAFDQSMF